MQVELKFKEPFFGIAYADFDRNSACQVVGKGAISYTLELPLKGCGTKQVGPLGCPQTLRASHCGSSELYWSGVRHIFVRRYLKSNFCFSGNETLFLYVTLA
jgi:hypothetical protein